MADQSDFPEWVVGAHGGLRHFAELTCGDVHQAEDLVQDALVQTFAAWSRVRTVNPDAYARRCIVNRRIDWWRRRSSREMPFAEIPDSLGADFTAQADRRLLVLAALRRLTRRERTVVAMRFWLGLTEAQIADELRIAVGTVKSTTARAVAKLRAAPELGKDLSDDCFV